ncbi:MAG: hypothetical protein PHR22_05410 [Candidatus Omnitrophica bacterium]|nr:hypothetical protein [Candidatus Omnitrophota bacterium]
MKKYIYLLALAMVLAPSTCRADGLGTLMRVGKSMDEIQRDYDRETAAYSRVKEAIGNGGIKKGVKQAAVLKYGEPVVVVTEAMRKRQVWVYRPGTTDLLNKPKIRLFFDDSGVLDQITVVE